MKQKIENLIVSILLIIFMNGFVYFINPLKLAVPKSDIVWVVGFTTGISFVAIINYIQDAMDENNSIIPEPLKRPMPKVIPPRKESENNMCNRNCKKELTTKELMEQLTSRLKINLQENEVVCPTCKGLRFILIEKDTNKAYISSCNDCYDGKNILCKYCGEPTKSGFHDCEGYNKALQDENLVKELEIFNKATKIKFDDYEGQFIWGDFVIDKDDLLDKLNDMISEGEEPPKYIYGIKVADKLSIDINDEITNKCEDLYEDAYDNLDTESELLVEAQKLINQWIENQGVYVNCYEEDCSIIVLLDDVIEEIKYALH